MIPAAAFKEDLVVQVSLGDYKIAQARGDLCPGQREFQYDACISIPGEAPCVRAWYNQHLMRRPQTKILHAFAAYPNEMVYDNMLFSGLSAARETDFDRTVKQVRGPLKRVWTMKWTPPHRHRRQQ